MTETKLESLMEQICPWCDERLVTLKPAGGCLTAEVLGRFWHPRCADEYESAREQSRNLDSKEVAIRKGASLPSTEREPIGLPSSPTLFPEAALADHWRPETTPAMNMITITRELFDALSAKTFQCKARCGVSDPPQECNWPLCGCDPRADAVIDALREAELFQQAHREDSRICPRCGSWPVSLSREDRATAALPPVVAAVPEGPQDETGRRIEQHLNAVKGSPDWADLAEILDWYKRDVALLLAERRGLQERIKFTADYEEQRMNVKHLLDTCVPIEELALRPPVADSVRAPQATEQLRIEVETLRTLLAAWQKRAYEAERTNPHGEPVDPALLEPFLREMRENVIPSIVAAVSERQRLAAETRDTPLSDSVRASTSAEEIYPAVEDALAKHCRGFIDRPTSRSNIAELVEKVLVVYENEVQQRQLLQRQLEAVDRGVGFPHPDGKGRIQLIKELLAASSASAETPAVIKSIYHLKDGRLLARFYDYDYFNKVQAALMRSEPPAQKDQ